MVFHCPLHLGKVNPKPTAQPVTTPKKAEIPTIAEQQEAEKLIQEVFVDEFAEAITNSTKRELAEKLYKQAQDTEDDLTAKYALFKEAKRLAAEANQAKLALSILNSMADRFAIELDQEQEVLLDKLAESASTPTEHADVLQIALQQLEMFVDSDNFPAAGDLIPVIETAAPQSRDPQLLRLSEEKIERYQVLKEQFSKIASALETLKESPNNQEACHQVGEYYCLFKNDWEQGLPLLANSNVQELQAAAKLELAEPADVEDQARLGDLWWDLAQNGTNELRKLGCETRAAYWYQRCITDLQGFAKSKVEKRLADIGSEIPITPSVSKDPFDSKRQAAIDLGLAWLARNQRPNGSWSFAIGPNGGMDKSDLGATAMAVICFLRAGNTPQEGRYKSEVDQGLQYLMKNAKVGSAGADLRGGSNLYAHAIGAIALCEATQRDRSNRPLRQAAQLAIKYTLHCQDPQGGGWRYEPRQPGDTSASGWHISALHLAQQAGISVPRQTLNGATFFLNSVASNGGSYYGYKAPRQDMRASTTAIGLLCRLWLGAKANQAPIARGVKELQSKEPSEAHAYYNYYATELMHEVGGEDWEAWRDKVFPLLLQSQQQQGPTAGSWSPKEKGEIEKRGGRLCTTCLNLMTLLAE